MIHPRWYVPKKAMIISFLCLVAGFIHASRADERPTLPFFVDWLGVRTAPTTYENVQRLQHLGAIQLERMMGFFSETLGVQCMFCHRPQNYGLDQKTHKLKAREMIRLVQLVNESFFGRERATCYTCHGGRSIPEYLPEGFGRVPGLTSPMEGKEPSEPSFVNVRRLGHLNQVDLARLMSFFLASLGVESCGYCHDPGNFSSDERTAKQQARRMIEMAQVLIPIFFRDELPVCYTCHKGAARPAGLPENWRNLFP